MKALIFQWDQTLGHTSPSPTKQTTSAPSAHHGVNAAAGHASLQLCLPCKASPEQQELLWWQRQRGQAWVLTFDAAAAHAQAAGVGLQRGLARELIPRQVPSR